jgi:CheY-like chemotaxis protein
MFRVTLPAATGEVVVSHERPAPALRRASVLVIDDEPLITKGMRRMLRDHDVVAAEGAREALGRILAGEHFDVILCDLMMPEMTGIELHEEVARHAPAMLERMVFVTGGAFTESARAFLARPGIEHLEKPVDFKLLRSLIRARLS